MEEKLMANDPKGEKHPADISDAAIVDNPIATGDDEVKALDSLNRDKDEQVSGAVEAKAPTSARRKEIDKAADSPRWEG